MKESKTHEAASHWQFKWESRPILEKMNSSHHEIALRLFVGVVLAHWAEHLAQAYQIYILQWPIKEARGVLGIPFPWLVSSELMHYSYALIMLVGLWVLRRGFVGRSYFWWMVSFGIQFWHHIEHLILQLQVLARANLWGSPVPISLIQLVGLVNGTADDGFGGILTAPSTAQVSFLMLFVRRVEVHMIYNTLVFIPMVIAMYYHLFPSKMEMKQMKCSCDWHAKLLTAS